MSGYVMVPGWLREMKPSGNAVLAYVNLASFGRFDTAAGVYEECRPRQDTLAEAMGVSKATAKRAVDELVEFGAVVRTLRYRPDGGQAPSVYRVVFGSLQPPTAIASRRSTTPHPRLTGEPGVSSPVSRGRLTGEPRTRTHDQEGFDQEENQPPPVPPTAEVAPDRPRRSRREKGDSSRVDNPNPTTAQLVAVFAETRKLTEDQAADLAALIDATSNRSTTASSKASSWTPTRVLAAIDSAVTDRPEPFPVLIDAARRCFTDPMTFAPARLTAYDGPWWPDAATAAQKRPATTAPCRSCAPYTRGQVWIDDDPDRPMPCPACRPGDAQRFAERRADRLAAAALEDGLDPTETCAALAECLAAQGAPNDMA